jgi:hypothetical protein
MKPDVEAALRRKLPAVFFDIAPFYRECEQRLQKHARWCQEAFKALGEKPTAEQRTDHARRVEENTARLLAWVQETALDIDRRHGDVPFSSVPFSYLYAPTGERGSDHETFVRWLHWERHGESWDATWVRDSQGDLTAWDAISRTGADVRKVMNKKAIKPFQGDPVHRGLLEIVITYEGEPLTDEERAACFDEYCACGKTHSADALRKQYSRLKKDLDAAPKGPGKSR